MNFDQFASTFQNAEGESGCGEFRVPNQEGDVLLAGTILAARDKSCCLDINGAQYEIASSDVIDIQVISSTKSRPTDSTDAIEPSDDVVGKDAEDASAKPGPQTVLIRVNRNAVLSCRIPVQAALLATVGTWMQVVLPAAEAA